MARVLSRLVKIREYAMLRHCLWFVLLLLVACSAPSQKVYFSSTSPATMRPYTVLGQSYQPQPKPKGYTFRGTASWYGKKFHGRKTASGERFNMHDLTAAHTTLPMNTQVRVCNRNNGKSVVVRINDRGPFAKNRVIDVSRRAAEELGMIGSGTAPVEVTVLNAENASPTPVVLPEQIDSGSLPSTPIDPAQILFDDMPINPMQNQPDSNQWAVQIGAFSQADSAERWRAQYDGYQGFSASTQVENQQGQPWYKVYLSGFANEAEARFFVEHSPFYGAFIRPF